MRILDRLCDVTDALVVKIYGVRTSSPLLKSIVNEIGWGVEVIDDKLNEINDAQYASQTFQRGEEVEIVCRKYDIRKIGVVEFIPGDEYTKAYPDRYSVLWNGGASEGFFPASELRKI